MTQLAIEPVNRPVRASIRPRGSKSLTNRALVCAALADGQSCLSGALDSEDTRVMVDSLSRLGTRISADWDGEQINVTGCGGRIPGAGGELYVANSGTTLRFLSAVAALGRGEYRLDGVARMRERPVGELAAALRQLGADVSCESPGDCPPVVVRATGLAGGEVEMRGDVSGQCLSGLLMAAPYATGDVSISINGPLVSRPYVEMTLGLMREFGVTVEKSGTQRFLVRSGRYAGRNFAIEPDASAASYFWAAAAITGSEVAVEGLSLESLQGDIRFCESLAAMGCAVEYNADSIKVIGRPLRGIEVDMGEISDTVQTLAAVALFATGPTTIRGVAHIRHKETDRVGDLVTELRRLGADVEELPHGLRITPQPLRPAEIETYNDHRMAMSLAVVGLKQPGVVIKDPQCTAKTYPRFFDDLRGIVKA